MEPLRDKIIGIPRSKNELSNIIGEMLSHQFNANIMQADADQVDIGDMNMNACYDPEMDSFGKACIEITLVYSPYETMLIFDNDGFDSLTRRLCDAVAHEQIHKHQYRERFWEGWDYDIPEGEDDVKIARMYLGNKDEIDAYSHNIANELLDYTDCQNVLTLLANFSTIRLEQSVNLWVYVNTFGRDINHPVIKRLLKKIIRRLPELELQR
jgi:hypothetical protein